MLNVELCDCALIWFHKDECFWHISKCIHDMKILTNCQQMSSVDLNFCWSVALKVAIWHDEKDDKKQHHHRGFVANKWWSGHEEPIFQSLLSDHCNTGSDSNRIKRSPDKACNFSLLSHLSASLHNKADSFFFELDSWRRQWNAKENICCLRGRSDLSCMHNSNHFDGRTELQQWSLQLHLSFEILQGVHSFTVVFEKEDSASNKTQNETKKNSSVMGWKRDTKEKKQKHDLRCFCHRQKWWLACVVDVMLFCSLSTSSHG